MPVSGALTDGRGASAPGRARRSTARAGRRGAVGARRQPAPAAARQRPRAIAAGLRRTRPVPPDLDLELGQVGPLEQARPAGRSSAEQLDVAARRRLGAGRRVGAAAALVGHASDRRKIERGVLAAEAERVAERRSRIVAARATFGRQVEARRLPDPGRSRLIVGGTQPSRIARIVDDRLDRAGRAERVPEHRLVGGDRDRAGVRRRRSSGSPGARPCRPRASRSRGR